VIRGSISTHDLPANVAFEVLLRSNGKEEKLGAIIRRAHAAKQGSGIEAGWEGGPLAKGDIILRSSKRIAKNETVDLYEYWKGELVFKDVEIK